MVSGVESLSTTGQAIDPALPLPSQTRSPSSTPGESIIQPQHYPLLIALFSLVLIPIVVKLWNHYWALWQANRAAKLDASIAAKLTTYATTEEVEMQLENLQRQQEAHHVQNRELLQSIKDDGLRREGMILGQLKQAQDETRATNQLQTDALGEVHRRIDRVLELQGERRMR